MPEYTPDPRLVRWQQELRGHTPDAVLRWAEDQFGERVQFATSLGLEDQVITHLIAEHTPSIQLFTLDTGRLFEETYDLIERTEARYGLKIHICFPDRERVREMVEAHGINLFRRSVEQRKLCCDIRKLEPLRQALADLDAWVCGLRREQAVTRTETRVVEWDAAHQMVKINPLVDWSLDQVWEFVRTHDVPYNPLHDNGFPSIGCASCTRAVKPGEDIRAGRWWWESPAKKECGLHLVDGKLIPASETGDKQ